MTKYFCTFALNDLVVSLEVPEPHFDGEGQDVFVADGWKLQQPTDGRQLTPGHVVKSDVVLKQFGELLDLLDVDRVNGVASSLDLTVKVDKVTGRRGRPEIAKRQQLSLTHLGTSRKRYSRELN